MVYIALLSFVVSVGLMILSFVFRLAGKLRITLPVAYFLLISTVLNPWAAAHSKLAFIILFILLAFSIISWIRAFKDYWDEKQYYKAMQADIRFQVDRAKKQGVNLRDVYIDPQGNMRYIKNNQHVV